MCRCRFSVFLSSFEFPDKPTVIPKLESSNLGYIQRQHSIGQKFLGRFDLAVGHLVFAFYYTTKLSGNFQSCTGSLDCKFTFHFSQLASHNVEKNRPDGVPVSMAPVWLLNLMHCLCNFPTRSTRFLTLQPRQPSFQTTRISPSHSISNALVNTSI